MKKKTFASLFIVVGLTISAPVISDPPDQSGPIVFRFEGFTPSIPIWVPDMKRGISASLGIDTIDFCTTFTFDTVEPVSIKNILVPEDPNRVNEQISGYVLAQVWPFTVFDCAMFLSVPPLATGYVKVNGTDNDLFVFNNPDNVNHNAFGITAHGDVVDLTGDMRKFSFAYRANWDGNDPTSFNEVFKVQLKQ